MQNMTHEEVPTSLPHAPHDAAEVISLPEYVGEELHKPYNRKNYLPGRLIDIAVLGNHISARITFCVAFIFLNSWFRELVYIWAGLVILTNFILTLLPVTYLLYELVLREKTLTQLARQHFVKKEQPKQQPKPVVIPVREYESDEDIAYADQHFIDELEESNEPVQEPITEPLPHMKEAMTIHSIPSHVTPFRSWKMSTANAIFIPIGFEIISLQAFILITIVYVVSFSRLPEDQLWTITSILPLCTGVFTFLLKQIIPFFDINNAIAIVNRTVFYNGVG
jgi:hypothetical protein